MIRAYQLSTGPDGHSHVIRGSIVESEMSDVETIHFKETPPHSSLDWHTAPTTQYVITLSGVLEFIMHSGEMFTIEPGDVLIALDTVGSGHKWRLVNDQPWKRAYVVLKEGAKINFQADDARSNAVAKD